MDRNFFVDGRSEIGSFVDSYFGFIVRMMIDRSRLAVPTIFRYSKRTVSLFPIEIDTGGNGKLESKYLKEIILILCVSSPPRIMIIILHTIYVRYLLLLISFLSL